MLAVSKGGKHVTTLRTTRGFYPSQDPTLGQIGRFFNGNADSNVGLRAGLTKDIWTVINPDLAPLQGLINQGDRLFAAALPKAMRNAGKLPPAQARASINQLWALRDQAIAGIASRFVSHPWPVNFLLIVDPLVTWIWIGAIIIAFGGLIALWPIPALAWRRRRTARVALRPGAPAVGPAVREPATAGAAREPVSAAAAREPV